MSRSLRTVVICPTYNEADNIQQMARRLREAEPDVDLLIVDDNSPDGTGAIADELAAADEPEHPDAAGRFADPRRRLRGRMPVSWRAR